MDPKFILTSKTVQGLIAAAIGVAGLITSDPTILTPLVSAGVLDAAGAGKVNAILATIGVLYAAWGRVRPGGGAPLTLSK